MPRVPLYDSLQASPTSLPSVRLNAPDMPDVAGRQAQEMGQGLMQAGGEVGRIALDMQNTANQLRVDDALNQAKETALRLAYDKEEGFTNLKGINALERPDGKPLADEYGDKLNQQIQQLSGSLGNDAQRQAFARSSNDILTSFKGQAIQHESSEYKTYALSVSDGVQSTALRDIGLNWNNPDAINSAVDRIKAETFRQAQLLGKSAEWQEAAARKLTSNAHKTALLAALENNDVTYADSYLKKYSGQMDADDILAVRGHITKEMDARVGVTVAAEVINKIQPRIQVSEAERAFNIAVNTESNGKQFDRSGKPLTSPKGAIGIAQVMPTTAPEAAKMAGLKWDENRYKNDPDYNKAIGLAYFQRQLQDFGGDLQLAYAAYNAGPGAVRAALKKQGPMDLSAIDPTQKNWLGYLPKETQDYVAKNMREYSAGQGQPSKPTFAEIDASLRADPRLTNNPERYKIAREDARRRFDDQVNAIKQREDEAVANAMRGVVENGGRYSDLPVSLRTALPPEKIDTVMNFAQKISKGDDSTNLWLYNKLESNPDALARMSDDQFFALRGELSDSDYKHFASQRGKQLNATENNGPGSLNSVAIKQTLDDRIRMLGLDPSPKDGSGEAERVGGIRKFVNDYFATAQREAGKKFTDAEVAQHIDLLFARNTTFRGYFSDTSGPMLTMKTGDIPSEDKSAIKAAFKRNGVDKPTDAQIMDIYWKQQITRK